ncbi:M23 family metallopeptidase [Qipengyuania sediminis]|uniref:M23 family metallopeptidase n=1 Tax=Qipengyuania sediminis TaxID=1532023 RepID=UPI001F10F502|nr:M23 family metallopeptidase [Qipengyuania sediminis]
MNPALNAGGAARRLRNWFPEREFFMRSQGQVRFIKVTTRLQLSVVGAAAAALLAWGGSMAAAVWSSYSDAASRAALEGREARIASSEQRIRAHGSEIRALGADLERRQDFLEDVVASLPQDVKAEAAAESEGAVARTKISAALPEAGKLHAIEARQTALAERLTRFADSRAARAEGALRKLGLDPQAIANTRSDAMGGPLHRYAAASVGGPDARFVTLGRSLARMNALVQGLERVPRVLPASLSAISSGFGYRHDPFTGAAAMHSGLDFRGPIGAPIHAAAKGRISFVGTQAGYGNTVEISHGNGLVTRYAHMSRFSARVGQDVAAGAVIGAIGNTGRSTGPHLHFEVRHHGRALNPRLFLERAPDVLEEIRRPAVRAAR